MEEETLISAPSETSGAEISPFVEADSEATEASALNPSYTDTEAEEFIPAIEAILFTAEHPVTVERLKTVFGDSAPTDEQLTGLVAKIREKYRPSTFGFEIREAQGGFYFVTKIQNAEPFRLGRSALETLAIVAYRQPVTRAEIDKVRGIDSSHLMRTLMERGLVKMAGKADVPGRPVQYATTPRFLEVLGLTSLGELPPLTELDQLQGHTEDPAKVLEEGLDKFMSEKMSVMEAEDPEGLNAIETLIDSVEKTPREVYASQTHAEVAAENELALQSFLAFMKPYRRRVVAETNDAEDLSTLEPTDAPPSPSDPPLIN
jgi:segregation and condensation protein B